MISLLFIKQAKQSNGVAPNIRDDLFEFRALTNRFGLGTEWDKRQVNVDSSGGEKKKNELIQMLMLNPKCAILDEPDSGLDVDGIKLLTEKLNEYIESDPTKVLIIITHYEKLIEDLNVSSVSIMKDANIKQHEGKDIAYQIFKEGFANV